MADVTTARPGLAGRDRVRAEGAAGTGYRTFPARLPVLLTAAGGVFVVLGALGASVRASALARVRTDPTEVRVLMGSDQASGWMLAGLGIALAVSGVAWTTRRAAPKVSAAVLVLLTGAVVVSRLLWFNERGAEWAAAAALNPNFIGFHAGLGWGAWCLLVGSILAAFGLLVGFLREIDLRKGIAG